MSTKYKPKKRASQKGRVAVKCVPQFLFDLKSAEGEVSDPVVVERIAKEYVGAVEKLKALDIPSRVSVAAGITRALNTLTKGISVVLFDRDKKPVEKSAELPLAEAPKEESKPEASELFA